MFCGTCGAQINDGAAFCPNCGSVLNQKPASTGPSGPGNAPAWNTGRPDLLSSLGDTGKLRRILTLCALGLLILCLVMSLLEVFSLHSLSAEGMKVTMSDLQEQANVDISLTLCMHDAGAGWLLILGTLLMVGAICVLLLGMFDVIKGSLPYLIAGGASGVTMLMLIIKWIAGGYGGLISNVLDQVSKVGKIPGLSSGSLNQVTSMADELGVGLSLTFAGWLMFLGLLFAAAACVLLFFVEQMGGSESKRVSAPAVSAGDPAAEKSCRRADRKDSLCGSSQIQAMPVHPFSACEVI